MTHLRTGIVIHAPLHKVYDVAHDPERWDRWWVGISEPVAVSAGTRTRQIMVGIPFPLIERVDEDELGETAAHWRTHAESHGQTAPCTPEAMLVLPASDQSWSCVAHGDETEVTVDVDCHLSRRQLEQLGGEAWASAIEERCLRRSLERLRRLCEQDAEETKH